MRNVIELYHRGMSAEALAQVVIAEYFDGKEPSFPIDPFKMIRDLGIVYQFMEFKDLEGIYILPDDEDDIPVIGINFGRPITRQRFASELLMPTKYLRDEARKYAVNGKVNRSDILKIAEHFGNCRSAIFFKKEHNEYYFIVN